MTAAILAQLRARLQTQARPLSELHRAATAGGSGWSEDQIALLLACLPDVEEDAGQARTYRLAGGPQEDPVTRALLELATATPATAAVLVSRLPRGLLSTPAALCEIARRHPDLELIGTNRIRHR